MTELSDANRESKTASSLAKSAESDASKDDTALLAYCEDFLSWKGLSPTAPAAVIARALRDRLAAPPVTLENIAFWYMANVAGPVFGTQDAIDKKIGHQRAAAIAFAEKIAKDFPGILTGGKS